MHHMRASGGTVVLVASTSGYFGGTGVAAYISSKHAVIGLLRSSQATAIKNNIRVNAVAPFFTPTHITSSYAEKWKEAGLEANTPDGVAAVIMQASLEKKSGMCILVRAVMLYGGYFFCSPFLRFPGLKECHLLNIWLISTSCLGVWTTLKRNGRATSRFYPYVGRGRCKSSNERGREALCRLRRLSTSQNGRIGSFSACLKSID